MKHNKQELDAIIDDADARYTRRADRSIDHQSVRGACLGAGQSAGGGKFFVGKFKFGRFKYNEH